MGKGFNYIRGINLSNCRRIVKYEFAGYYIRVDQNNDEHTYDIYLKEGVEPDRVQYFQEYWGPQYRIYITSKSKLEKKEQDY